MGATSFHLQVFSDNVGISTSTTSSNGSLPSCKNPVQSLLCVTYPAPPTLLTPHLARSSPQCTSSSLPHLSQMTLPLFCLHILAFRPLIPPSSPCRGPSSSTLYPNPEPSQALITQPWAKRHKNVGLRPSCKAWDCLLIWSPLRPRSPHNAKALLSHDDIARIYEVIAFAWANSTKETYGTGLLTFHIFCDAKSIPEADQAPTNNTIIAAFLASLVGSYSGSTITNYLCGIKVWHTIHGIPWTLNETESDALLKATVTLAPASAK